jgi:L-iditol 2-dehydrogenase
VRRGGLAMLFGGCPGGTSVRFDTRRLHYDQISLLSPFHFGTEAVRTARQWLIEGKVDFSPLLTGVRTLEEADRVFEDLRNGLGIKYVFVP